MIQCELEDGRIIFVNLDRVITISNRVDGKMVLAYTDAEGKVKQNAIKRFQVVKTATWFKADRA